MPYSFKPDGQDAADAKVPSQPPDFKSFADNYVKTAVKDSAVGWDSVDDHFAKLPMDASGKTQDASSLKRNVVDSYVNDVLPQYYPREVLPQMQARARQDLTPAVDASKYTPKPPVGGDDAEKDRMLSLSELRDETSNAVKRTKANVALDAAQRRAGKSYIKQLGLNSYDTDTANDLLWREKQKRTEQARAVKEAVDAGSISVEEGQKRLDTLAQETLGLEGAERELNDHNFALTGAVNLVAGAGKAWLGVADFATKLATGTVSGLSGNGFAQGWGDTNVVSKYLADSQDSIDAFTGDFNSSDGWKASEEAISAAFKDGGFVAGAKAMIDNPKGVARWLGTQGPDFGGQMAVGMATGSAVGLGAGWLSKATGAVKTAEDLATVMKAAQITGMTGATTAYGANANAREVRKFVAEQFNAMDDDTFLSMPEIQAESSVWMRMSDADRAQYIAQKKRFMLNNAEAEAAGLSAAVIAPLSVVGLRYGLEGALLEGSVGKGIAADSLGSYSKSYARSAVLSGTIEATSTGGEMQSQQYVTVDTLHKDWDFATPFRDTAEAMTQSFLLSGLLEGSGGIVKQYKDNKAAAAAAAAAPQDGGETQAAPIQDSEGPYTPLHARYFDNIFTPPHNVDNGDGSSRTTPPMQEVSDYELENDQMAARVDRAYAVFADASTPYSMAHIESDPALSAMVSDEHRAIIARLQEIAGDHTQPTARRDYTGKNPELQGQKIADAKQARARLLLMQFQARLKAEVEARASAAKVDEALRGERGREPIAALPYKSEGVTSGSVTVTKNERRLPEAAVASGDATFKAFMTGPLGSVYSWEATQQDPSVMARMSDEDIASLNRLHKLAGDPTQAATTQAQSKARIELLSRLSSIHHPEEGDALRRPTENLPVVSGALRSQTGAKPQSAEVFDPNYGVEDPLASRPSSPIEAGQHWRNRAPVTNQLATITPPGTLTPVGDAVLTDLRGKQSPEMFDPNYGVEDPLASRPSSSVSDGEQKRRAYPPMQVPVLHGEPIDVTFDDEESRARRGVNFDLIDNGDGSYSFEPFAAAMFAAADHLYTSPNQAKTYATDLIAAEERNKAIKNRKGLVVAVRNLMRDADAPQTPHEINARYADVMSARNPLSFKTIMNEPEIRSQLGDNTILLLQKLDDVAGEPNKPTTGKVQLDARLSMLKALHRVSDLLDAIAESGKTAERARQQGLENPLVVADLRQETEELATAAKRLDEEDAKRAEQLDAVVNNPVPLEPSKTALALEAGIALSTSHTVVASAGGNGVKAGVDVTVDSDGDFHVILSGDPDGTARIHQVSIDEAVDQAAKTATDMAPYEVASVALTGLSNRIGQIVKVSGIKNTERLFPAVRYAVYRRALETMRSDFTTHFADGKELTANKARDAATHVAVMRRSMTYDAAAILDGPRGRNAKDYVTGKTHKLVKRLEPKQVLLDDLRKEWFQQTEVLDALGTVMVADAVTNPRGLSEKLVEAINHNETAETTVLGQVKDRIAVNEMLDATEAVLASELPPPESADEVSTTPSVQALDKSLNEYSDAQAYDNVRRQPLASSAVPAEALDTDVMQLDKNAEARALELPNVDNAASMPEEGLQLLENDIARVEAELARRFPAEVEIVGRWEMAQLANDVKVLSSESLPGADVVEARVVIDPYLKAIDHAKRVVAKEREARALAAAIDVNADQASGEDATSDQAVALVKLPAVDMRDPAMQELIRTSRDKKIYDTLSDQANFIGKSDTEFASMLEDARGLMAEWQRSMRVAAYTVDDYNKRVDEALERGLDQTNHPEAFTKYEHETNAEGVYAKAKLLHEGLERVLEAEAERRSNEDVEHQTRARKASHVSGSLTPSSGVKVLPEGLNITGAQRTVSRAVFDMYVMNVLQSHDNGWVDADALRAVIESTSSDNADDSVWDDAFSIEGLDESTVYAVDTNGEPLVTGATIKAHAKKRNAKSGLLDIYYSFKREMRVADLDHDATVLRETLDIQPDLYTKDGRVFVPKMRAAVDATYAKQRYHSDPADAVDTAQSFAHRANKTHYSYIADTERVMHQTVPDVDLWTPDTLDPNFALVYDRDSKDAIKTVADLITVAKKKKITGWRPLRDLAESMMQKRPKGSRVAGTDVLHIKLTPDNINQHSVFLRGSGGVPLLTGADMVEYVRANPDANWNAVQAAMKDRARELKRAYDAYIDKANANLHWLSPEEIGAWVDKFREDNDVGKMPVTNITRNNATLGAAGLLNITTENGEAKVKFSYPTALKRWLDSTRDAARLALRSVTSSPAGIAFKKIHDAIRRALGAGVYAGTDPDGVVKTAAESYARYRAAIWRYGRSETEALHNKLITTAAAMQSDGKRLSVGAKHILHPRTFKLFELLERVNDQAGKEALKVDFRASEKEALSYGGIYQPYTQETVVITVDMEGKPAPTKAKAYNLVHEYVHKVTVDMLWLGELVDELRGKRPVWVNEAGFLRSLSPYAKASLALYDTFKTIHAHVRGVVSASLLHDANSLEQLYGLKNHNEMLAELSSPEFTDLLDSIMLPDNVLSTVRAGLIEAQAQALYNAARTDASDNIDDAFTTNFQDALRDIRDVRENSALHAVYVGLDAMWKNHAASVAVATNLQKMRVDLYNTLNFKGGKNFIAPSVMLWYKAAGLVKATDKPKLSKMAIDFTKAMRAEKGGLGSLSFNEYIANYMYDAQLDGDTLREAMAPPCKLR